MATIRQATWRTIIAIAVVAGGVIGLTDHASALTVISGKAITGGGFLCTRGPVYDGIAFAPSHCRKTFDPNDDWQLSDTLDNAWSSRPDASNDIYTPDGTVEISGYVLPEEGMTISKMGITTKVSTGTVKGLYGPGGGPPRHFTASLKQCPGDSGAPAWTTIDGKNYVVGMLQSGNTNLCSRPPGTVDPAHYGGGGPPITAMLADMGNPLCQSYGSTIVGTDGDDTLVGTPGIDVIYGGGGNDVIEGLGGGDIICGGDGDDQIRGGDGDDTIDGDAGDDIIDGGDGDDTARGGTGYDNFTNAKIEPDQRLLNVGGGGTARQSSNSYGGHAARAIDGNTDGEYRNRSITHTKREEDPFWEVDLGSHYPIEQITVWNRTGCCSERLDGAIAFFSREPFSTDDADELLSLADDPDSGVFAQPLSVGDDPDITAEVGQWDTRYVRIQLNRIGWLSLAEVQLWSPTDSGTFATQSSTGFGAPAARAIDGNTDGSFRNGSVSHTAGRQRSPWWNMQFSTPRPISHIKIWNRTDCCSGRLDDVVVKVSTTSANACHGTVTFESTPAVGRDTALVIPTTSNLTDPPLVRSICITKPTIYLSLAEVEFFEEPPPAQDDATMNVATSGTVRQSSVEPDTDGSAELAIDADADGMPILDTVAVTEIEQNPWWELDLGQARSLQQVTVNHRVSNAYPAQPSGLWIFSSPEPFSSDDPAQTADDPAVQSWYVDDISSSQLVATLDAAREARFVRVQFEGTGQLALANVGVDSVVANGALASQSSNLTDVSVAGLALDGSTRGNYRSGSVTHTAKGDVTPWWNAQFAHARPVQDVFIFNRTDCCKNRLEGATIKVSTTSVNACADDDAATFPIGTIGDPATHVRIADDTGAPIMATSLCITKDAKFLSLAEVSIFGIP